MSEIEWLDAALGDVDRIREYLKGFSEAAAQSAVDRIYHRVDALAQFPGMGRMIPELRSPLLRELIEEPYRILYEVFPKPGGDLRRRPLEAGTNPPAGR